MGGLGISVLQEVREVGAGLEGRLVGVAAAGRRGRTPRVVGRGAGGTARVARAGGAEPTATARAALGAVHLGGRVLQRRADLFDVKLDDRALLALTGLVRALLEPAGRDDAHPPLQRLGSVLGRLTPDRAAQEQRLAVLPLVAVAVEGPRCGG